ncbi:hypothetical protein BN85411820 [Alteracholeplasma palmae J233]|uniref:Uncharacterized protein n=1 Tax=Alteracholeplasma palmae (strain ATCC 49389 / J233) TaxID=1318466 RepID=U4KLF0_ALTPJ|nr:hypothetical protein [Alteracholeplasma palmae]CCV64759.1 hypothetical protein BN85411820 [Alteracholeplasma palmae J233]
MKKKNLFLMFIIGLFIIINSSLTQAFEENKVDISLDSDEIGIVEDGRMLGILDYPKLYGNNYSIEEKKFISNSVIDGNKSLNFLSYKNRFNAVISDDYIVNIVPKNEFTTIGKRIEIGKEYGYFIETKRTKDYYESIVVVFDISINFDLINNNDQITSRIMPIFQYTYITVLGNKLSVEIEPNYVEEEKFSTYYVDYQTVSNSEFTVTLKPSVSITEYNVWLQTVKTEEYFLNNISFGAIMYNENEPNFGDENYNQHNDNGAFFVGGYYEYEASTIKDSSSEATELLLDFVHTGIGYVEKIPVLALVTTIWDVVDLAVGTVELFGNLNKFETVTASKNNIGLTLNNITKGGQLANFGKLQKVISIVTDHEKSNAVFRNGQYVKATYLVNNSNESGIPDYTRLYNSIGISVSE